MKTACYADRGPLAIHWRAVTSGKRGTDWQTFLQNVASLPTGTLWRHNAAGDLFKPNTDKGQEMLWQLITANRGRNGFTYSHHKLTPRVVMGFKAATANGFTVNASVESEHAADSAVLKGLRVAMVVLSTETRRFWRTALGNPVVVCPATYREGMTCERCRLCSKRPQNVVIAFPAHGNAKRAADAIVASLA